MSAYDEVLSRQYHSLRIFTGSYEGTASIPYRIGNNSTTVSVATEQCYDTWMDWHLIPTDRLTVELPSHNSRLVTVPGRSTPLDFTTYLTGHPTFANRSGSWSFYTDPDFVERNGGWVAFNRNIRDKLHGRIRKVVLRDDPSYFYVGELTVSPMAPGDARSTVTISYNFYPYKKALLSTLDLWAFDDFDFQDGYIQYLENMEVNGSRQVNVMGSRERISPHIAGSGSLSVAKYQNDAWVPYGTVYTGNIDDAAAVMPGLVMDDGINQLRFSGNGFVTIDYRRGLL